MSTPKGANATSLNGPTEVPPYEVEMLAPRASRYLLVIPVINEGERIQRQMRRLHELGLALDVVIADGGSTDGSLNQDVLRDCKVRALLTKRGPGRLSAQLRMAYAWGLAEGYDGILTVDGNGKDGLEALPKFIAALDDGFDYVQGSRYQAGGQAINTPLDRKIGGRFLHAPVLSVASGTRLTDTTNGFRAYSRCYLTDPRVAPFRSCFSDYNLLFYLSVRAGQLGYRVTEVPVRREYPATGPTPTKMGSVGAKLRLVGELFRTALGGYHPDADQSLSEIGGPAATPVISLWLLPLVFLLILASRIAGILDAPDIWHDEGMLMANLPLPSLLTAFAPLPYYAQAAPPGYLMLASVVAGVAGDSPEIGLRLLSVAGSLGAAALLALALQRLGGVRVVPIALALVFLSPFGVRYGIEIKQYSFELMATCLMLYTTIRAVQRPDLKNLAILAASGAITILFSFAASILLAALALAAMLQMLLLGRSGAGPVAGVFALLIGFAAAWHLTVTTAATADQFSYFSFVYDKAYLQLPFFGSGDGTTIKSYFRIMLGMFDPFYRFASEYHAQRLFAYGGVILLGLGLLAGLRRGVLLPVVCIALLGGLAMLSIMRLYPILYTRHFIFVQPLVGILLAIGLLALFAWLSRRMSTEPQRTTTRIVAAFVALFGGIAVLAGVTQEKQQLSEALAVIKSTTDDPSPLIYVGRAAQPNMLYVAPDFGTQLGYGPGAFDPDFRKRSSTATLATDYAEQIQAHDEIWMVETLVYDGNFEQVKQDLEPLEAAFGPCQELHRSGSSADLGHTLAYRCRAEK